MHTQSASFLFIVPSPYPLPPPSLFPLLTHTLTSHTPPLSPHTQENTVAEEEAARLAAIEAEEEEEEGLINANLDNLDLSPYELALYMEEQRKKR
jgi:hypothetical protein